MGSLDQFWNAVPYDKTNQIEEYHEAAQEWKNRAEHNLVMLKTLFEHRADDYKRIQKWSDVYKPRHGNPSSLFTACNGHVPIFYRGEMRVGVVIMAEYQGFSVMNLAIASGRKHVDIVRMQNPMVLSGFRMFDTVREIEERLGG